MNEISTDAKDLIEALVMECSSGGLSAVARDEKSLRGYRHHLDLLVYNEVLIQEHIKYVCSLKRKHPIAETAWPPLGQTEEYERFEKLASEGVRDASRGLSDAEVLVALLCPARLSLLHDMIPEEYMLAWEGAIPTGPTPIPPMDVQTAGRGLRKWIVRPSDCFWAKDASLYDRPNGECFAEGEWRANGGRLQLLIPMFLRPKWASKLTVSVYQGKSVVHETFESGVDGALTLRLELDPEPGHVIRMRLAVGQKTVCSAILVWA